MLNSGQRLKCPRQGCSAKFMSVLGYNLHINNCGTKMEERQTFTCETCSKVYFSIPGLQYHIKNVHREPAKVGGDHSDGENESEQDEDELQDGQRKRRRAASRAIQRFHKMATDSEAMKGRQSLLDQLIVRVKESEFSKEEEQMWAKAMENDCAVQCPNKGCPETFTSLSDLTTHVSTCAKRSGSYKCLACNKVCLTYIGARKHVGDLHTGQKGDENSGSTDEDFEAGSSDESEEDDDDVEIEEIEESDGNIEEQETLTEEIVIWDKKRKRYRKPRKAKKSKKLLEALTSGKTQLDFGPIGDPDADGYLTTENWHNEVYKHKELFPKLKPSVKYWSRVEASEVHKYLPSSSESPRFQIRRSGSSFTEDIRLPLFESTSKDDSCIHGDVTFNVGGPVWAMNWCPVPDSQTCEEQFLAIGTHRTLDEVHNIHQCFSGPGLVQLWNTGPLDISSASSGITPTLCLGIAHNHGAVWDISWCPSGTWESIGQNSPEADCFPRLGLMALACSDGYVRIFSIPWPKNILSALRADQSVSTPGQSHVMVQAKPHFVLAPCAVGVEYNGQCGQAWCAKWFPGSLHEKIATGFSDGSVAIWNLLTESLLLKESISGEPEAFSLAPFLHIKTNSSVIKDVTWCPFDPHMFVTGSHDRHYKLWNLKSPVLPLCSLKRGIPHEIHWPVVFDSFFSCEEDTFQTLTTPAAVRYLAFFANDKSRNTETSALTVHNSTVWSLSVSDWGDVLVSSDAAGEVVGVVLSERRKRRALRKFGIYRTFLEHLNDDPSTKQDEENESEIKADDEPDERDRSQPNLTEQPPNSADPNVTNGKEKLSPESVVEVFRHYRLVFNDVNALEFNRNISEKDPDFRRLRNPSTMQSANYEELHPEAIHKVRFNPNKQSFTWLASGGAAGIARLHLVKQV